MMHHFLWQGQPAYIDLAANVAGFPSIGEKPIPAFAGIGSSSANATEEKLPKIETVFINATSRCNLHCTYCSVDQGRFSSPVSHLTTDIALSFLSFLTELDRTNQLADQFDIVFFGGEPFLNFSQLRQLAIDCRSVYGKRALLQIPTNGTVWSSSIDRFVSENDVHLIVSIDGPRSIHDRFRRYSSGAGSYARVEANIKKILASGCRTTGRPTIHSIADTADVVEFLTDIGFDKVMIGMDMFDVERKIDTEQAIDQFLRCANLIWQMGRTGRIVHLTNFNKTIERLMIYRRNIPDYCGAGASLLSVGSDGTIFPCVYYSKNACANGYSIGTIQDGIDTASRSTYVARNMAFASQCTLCWMRSICPGGCHFLRGEKPGYWSDSGCGLSHIPMKELIYVCLNVIMTRLSEDPVLFFKLFLPDCYGAVKKISQDISCRRQGRVDDRIVCNAQRSSEA